MPTHRSAAVLGSFFFSRHYFNVAFLGLLFAHLFSPILSVFLLGSPASFLLSLDLHPAFICFCSLFFFGAVFSGF